MQPFQEAGKGHSGAKLEIQVEMGTDKNRRCDQNTGQERQGQKRGTSKMETGLGQHRVRGGQRGHTGWGWGMERGTVSKHRAGLGKE